MKDLFVFGAGFASGWVARSNIDSVRETAVNLIAAGYRGAERLRVAIETEREFLQDILAEGRAHYEALRDANSFSPDYEEIDSSDERKIRAA